MGSRKVCTTYNYSYNHRRQDHSNQLISSCVSYFFENSLCKMFRVINKSLVFFKKKHSRRTKFEFGSAWVLLTSLSGKKTTHAAANSNLVLRECFQRSTNSYSSKKSTHERVRGFFLTTSLVDYSEHLTKWIFKKITNTTWNQLVRMILLTMVVRIIICCTYFPWTHTAAATVLP